MFADPKPGERAKELFKQIQEFADPRPRESVLSQMIYDGNRAKDLLLQIRELLTFNELFNEGERGSIKHLIETTGNRVEGIKELQKQFQ